MNIETVRDNLCNTIAGKERYLTAVIDGMKDSNDIDRRILNTTKLFLEINIDELKRILADVETCMEWDQYAISTFEKLEEFKKKRNYPIPPDE
jgi:hypothetical protein